MKVKIPHIDVKLSSTNKNSRNKGKFSKSGEVPLNEVSEFISRFTTK